jgi:undecaprenyl-diphosphatase
LIKLFFTGLSRIYLGVHWASDVVGGFALGFFWTTLSLIFLKLYEKRENMKVV